MFHATLLLGSSADLSAACTFWVVGSMQGCSAKQMLAYDSRVRVKALSHDPKLAESNLRAENQGSILPQVRHPLEGHQFKEALSDC